jgi:hypothetical protein
MDLLEIFVYNLIILVNGLDFKKENRAIEIAEVIIKLKENKSLWFEKSAINFLELNFPIISEYNLHKKTSN